jgi:murein hydrolase activator
MLRRAAPFLAVLIAATTAGAQPAQDLARTQAEQQRREAQRGQFSAQAIAARREVAQLNAQLAELIAAEARGESSVSDKRLKLAALSVQETELSARAGANRNQLSRLLGALQMFTRDPPPALFVHPRDAKDAVRAAILIRALTPELERRAKAFAAEDAEVRRLRREAVVQSEDLFNAESDVAERRAQIEALIAEKVLLERSLAGEILIADNEIAALAARARSLRNLVSTLPAAPAGKAASGRAPERLLAPVAGVPIRRFGDLAPDGRRSEGWDWRTPAGGQVASPAAGVVEYAGPLEGWGSVLILRLGGDYHLVLGGLEQVLVARGQSVAASQPLGRMANAKNLGVGSAAPDLHMELRRKGDPVDPARFMQ